MDCGCSYKFHGSSDYHQSHERNICNAWSTKSSCQWQWSSCALLPREFESFLEIQVVKHSLSAPYHPATNGLAERAVQTVKQGVTRQRRDRDLRDRLSIFLLQYWVTAQSTTGASPSQMLMRRRIRTRLDKIFPDGSGYAESKERQQAAAHGANIRERSFRLDQPIFVRDYSQRRPTWIPGFVSGVPGPVGYTCQTDAGEQQCHVDQMMPRWGQ